MRRWERRLPCLIAKEALVKATAIAQNEAFQEAFLSDRKYRQRGYQDSGSEPRKNVEKTEKPSAARRDNTYGPRPLNMPGTRTVSRCAECGAILENLSATLGQCPKCKSDLHSCKQCEYFDPSSRFECSQPIPARISPKDKGNNCTFFSIRVRLEKETSSKQAQRPNDARQAFENLFKK